MEEERVPIEEKDIKMGFLVVKVEKGIVWTIGADQIQLRLGELVVCLFVLLDQRRIELWLVLGGAYQYVWLCVTRHCYVHELS